MPKGVYQRSSEYRANLAERLRRFQHLRVYHPRTEEEKRRIAEGTKRGMAGRPVWNKGLTKDSHPSLKKVSEQFKGRIVTQEQREKIRATLKRTASRYWLGKHRSEETKAKLRRARLHQTFPLKSTVPERLIEQELQRRGIRFLVQQSLLDITIADFYLPDTNTVIYADGDYWHNLPNYQERDKRITTALQEHGYRVFRFWEKDIKTNVQLLLNTALT